MPIFNFKKQNIICNSETINHIKTQTNTKEIGPHIKNLLQNKPLKKPASVNAFYFIALTCYAFKT